MGHGDFVSRSAYRWDTDMNDLWRVHWIESGEGFVQGADGRRRWLRGGDVFAMYPQQPYHRPIRRRQTPENKEPRSF